MSQAQGRCIDIPSFIFRIEQDELEGYRRALGVVGERVPYGMALRALASEVVMSALRAAAAGRQPIHVAQEYKAERPLRAGVDYVCNVRLLAVGESLLRVEQSLCDASGFICLTLVSDIALVTT